MNQVNILNDSLYLGATQYDENFSVVPAGNGWKIKLGGEIEGRKTLDFIYVAADLTETLCQTIYPPTPPSS
jgi:hypothetical protein